MAGKKKTTFTKLARERKLRERRMDKQAKKEARRQGIAQPSEHSESPFGALPDEDAFGAEPSQPSDAPLSDAPVSEDR